MKALVVIVLLALAVAIAASVARTALSRERAVVDAVVIEYLPQSGNESRTIPLPGDILVRLSDGRAARLVLDTADDMKPGRAVRVSERIAPWGEVWYRLAP